MLQLVQLQVELERMNGENQRLRGMLSHVSTNYASLQMHLVTLMQQQQNSRADSTQEQEVINSYESLQPHFSILIYDSMLIIVCFYPQIADKKPEEERKENGDAIIPRQFLDLGPANRTADEQSNSSSEERTLSGSPAQNNLEISRNKRTGREESPESESWGPGQKAPRLNPVKPVDQSLEATMRKARVSVRARSEAPMVIIKS